jgi:hypothetical protein
LTSRITSIKSRLSPKHKKAFYGVRYRISDGNSTSERIVELMRLPMGVTFAPAVVQHITDAIICTYHEAQRLPSVQHDGQHTHRFLEEKERLLLAAAVLRRRGMERTQLFNALAMNVNGDEKQVWGGGVLG